MTSSRGRIHTSGNRTISLPCLETVCDTASCASPYDPYTLLVDKEQQFMQLRGESAALEKLLHSQQGRLVAEINQLRHELQELQSGRAWRMTQVLRRWRQAIVPVGGRRHRGLRLGKRMFQVWRDENILTFLRRGGRKSISLWQRLLDSLGRRMRKTSTPSADSLRTVVSVDSISVPLSAAESVLLRRILALAPKKFDPSVKPIDVVIPVYKGRGETLRCLRSVLAAQPSTAYELVVINDASPDTTLTTCLRDIAACGAITLLENPCNYGFVKTANRGLALHPDRDVVLLNSDTEVCRDWLDRLHKAAYSAKNVGTVTPLSNSATICSYPLFCQDNLLPRDAAAQQLDELCSQHNAGAYVEIPTGVGFCMYFRRDCLESASLLDEEHFGKGYGEENDFCLRATRNGWRHLLTTDTFVYHRGGTSFGASKNPAVDRAMKVMDKLHPDYHALVAGHILADPALSCRRRLDLARLARQESAVLYVLHNLGGGTQKHVLELAERLEQEGRRAILLMPLDAGRVRLTCPAVPNTPNLIFAVPEEHWTLAAALRQLGVNHVHIHHTLGVPRDVFRLIKNLNVPYDWTIHDYYTICPRVNLIDESGIYCGEPNEAQCQICVDRNGGHSVDSADIRRWREESRQSLTEARKVFVPHHDAAARLTRYFPEVEFTERRHFEKHSRPRPVAAPFVAGETLRVTVIGALGLHKGVDIVFGCAVDGVKRNLPIHFHIVGYTACDEVFHTLPNVTLTGSYKEEKIFELLESLRCHCAFFPSVWPETYTYTLSIAFLGKIFPVAFDLGAPAERIRECDFGQIIPLTQDAVAVNDALLALRERLTSLSSDWQWRPAEYRSLLADYYELLGDASCKCRSVA